MEAGVLSPFSEEEYQVLENICFKTLVGKDLSYSTSGFLIYVAGIVMANVLFK